ncbi:hypothetical protein BOQ62_19115 [Chryseobacterium sp. CH21]|nr:hypothetical protein BOQ62_19115 [Chryseobacterium sp. CH21]
MLDTKTTDYLGGFQYENSVLKFFPTAEGYFNVETGKYVYNYTDHLGNVRLSYAKNGAGTEIIEESNYYPFGLKHEGYNTLLGNPAYNYKYNGKELQENGMYDYGARMYMPDLGRWGVMDAMSEKFSSLSPYNYALNSPVMVVDPDGNFAVSYSGEAAQEAFKAYRETMSVSSETSSGNYFTGLGSSPFGKFDWILENINGVSKWSYNANIKTVSQALAAGYKDAAAIYSYANISGEGFLGFGKYGYSLNSDGSVVNSIDGSVLGGSFSTPAGTMISTGSFFSGSISNGFFKSWANSSNIAAKFTYGIANNAYVTAQIFDVGLLERPEWANPLGGNYGNLDGTPNYKQADALVSTLATAAPYARGAKAVNSIMPEGMSILSRFESTSGASGTINLLNKGVDYVNGTVGKGMIARPMVTGVINAAQPNSPVRNWMKRNVGYRPQFD